MQRADAAGAERSVVMCRCRESRMRNPHITVSGAIRVQRAARDPRCGELGDRQVRRDVNAGSEGHALVALNGGHRDI